MSNQDSRFDRIDPTFLDQMAPDGTFQGRYMAGDPKAELPKERWDEYRALFKRNHINLGIARDKDRDAFIMFDSQGLLDRGYATGVVFCSDFPTSSDPDVYRYEPFTSNEASGSGIETENPPQGSILLPQAKRPMVRLQPRSRLELGSLPTYEHGTTNRSSQGKQADQYTSQPV